MPDIKDWLRAAASTLAPGEVVKPESLNFLDAMNALEMMDPAMDWGVNISPKGSFDPAALVKPQQLCWIMDEMSARELAWHRGGTLAQTVYTSLHYHNTLLVSPRVERTHPDFPALEACTAALRAWVLGYAKSIEVAYHALLDANGAARDGEDVWLDAYGIPIETTETADEVATYLENETAWLAADAGRASDPWWANVLLRLRFRAQWLDALRHRPSQLDLNGLRLSTEAVPSAFDAVTPFLRQNMPLPVVTPPGHEATWAAFIAAADDLVRMVQMSGNALDELEESLVGVQLRPMLPIVRAIYKTELCEMPSRARLIDEWLQNATGLPPAILQRIDMHITGPNDRRSFALWRDIISGTLVQTLQVPLMNPTRQRRAYMHLARGWTDQASAAARLAHYPDMERLVPALHGRSLDCELHASLLAFDLGLVADNEQRAAWWWILAITRARARLGLVGTWEARWAQAWGAVAAALLLLYTVIPLASDDKTSRPHFTLRHKIALRARAAFVPPSADEWERTRAGLDAAVAKDAAAALDLALNWLDAATEHFRDLGVDTHVPVGGILLDLSRLVQAVSGGGELGWERRLSRVPLLVAHTL
ncbi:N-alpha-acetyltransferase 35, NatC auxiliary subunit [Vanrija pseudolonga]|uniref:N-alpha-acetyltransferase 35, NatC auxiliary subunit n=1 Tax=Vanrija pseudolonga TaxID=143232 RepID=A0AAF0YD78_9TREE|nr:N-alpha-acetyltransferase 35, NatC auxiliary subunit [Vanrija pseudolonga]